MAKRGRPPDHQRRHQVVALRSRGLTFKQIARRLGVTYQTVEQLFAGVAGPEQDARTTAADINRKCAARHIWSHSRSSAPTSKRRPSPEKFVRRVRSSG